MKKVLLVLLTGLILQIGVAKSQCWVTPPCEHMETVTGIIRNTNYQQSTCFEGSATFVNSANFNGWEYLSFNGADTVESPINMQGNSRIYVNGSIVMDYLHFKGGDTLFLFGSATIKKVVSNNSNPDKRNVIALDKSSSLIVEGHIYHIGDVIKTPGNTKNEIDVIGCDGGSALPVKIESFYLNGNTLHWKLDNTTNLKEIRVLGDINGKLDVDNPVATLAPDTTSYQLIFGGSLAFCLLLTGFKRKGRILALIVGTALIFGACSKHSTNNLPRIKNVG